MIYALIAIVSILFISSEISVTSMTPNYDDLFKKYANRFGLDWQILKTIAVIESNLGLASSVQRGLASPNDVEASKSMDGKSWGLMQVTLPTAKDYDPYATAAKLNNPDYSVEIASKHLKYLESLFDKSDLKYREWVIKSYNQGQGNTYREKSGGAGYANGYWQKYLTAYKKIVGF